MLMKQQFLSICLRLMRVIIDKEVPELINKEGIAAKVR